jgi:hypothetical protein
VAAFVHAAMMVHGLEGPPPKALPGILGVRVREDQDNPLGLALADRSTPAGLRARDADLAINRLFRELGSPIRFRRVPFREISMGLWVDVLDTALTRGVVAGLGVDFAVLRDQATERSAQHVLRILTRREQELELFDDSGETTPAGFSVSLERARAAVLAIPDGLWMIAQEPDLHLP